VTLLSRRRPVQGKVENIGPFHGLLSCEGLLPPLHGNFKMLIEVPDHKPLEIIAKVVWTAIGTADNGEIRVGTDVYFVKVTEAGREYLRRVISRQYKRTSAISPLTAGLGDEPEEEESLLWSDCSISFSC